MNWSTLILLLIIALLQYPLWLGKGGWVRVWEYERQVQAQRDVNQKLEQRNAARGGEFAQRDASAPDLGHAPPEHRHGDGEAESGHRQHRPEHVAVHRFHRHPRRGASSMCRCCGPPRDPAMGRP